MSAECRKCGADIVYPPGSWPLGVCPVCEKPIASSGFPEYTAEGTVIVPLLVATEIYDLLTSDEGLSLAQDAVIAKLVRNGAHYELHYICTPPRLAAS